MNSGHVPERYRAVPTGGDDSTDGSWPAVRTHTRSTRHIDPFPPTGCHGRPHLGEGAAAIGMERRVGVGRQHGPRRDVLCLVKVTGGKVTDVSGRSHLQVRPRPRSRWSSSWRTWPRRPAPRW